MFTRWPFCMSLVLGAVLLDAFFNDAHTQLVDFHRAFDAVRRSSTKPSTVTWDVIHRPINITDFSRATPCCQDSLMAGVCRAMSRRSPDRFYNLCRTNPDFSFIQCCVSCHFNSDGDNQTGSFRPITGDELYEKDVERMLQSPTAPCSDRRSPRFCEGLTHNKEVTLSRERANRKPHVRQQHDERSGFGRMRSMQEQRVPGIDGQRNSPCRFSAIAFRVCRKTCGFCTNAKGKAPIKFIATIAKSPQLCRSLH